MAVPASPNTSLSSRASTGLEQIRDETMTATTTAPPGTDPALRSQLQQAHRGRGRLGTITGIGVLLIVVSLVAIGTGAAMIDPLTTVQILSSRLTGATLPDWVPVSSQTIIMDVRLPRVITGILAGAALSAAGATLQSVVRNPLADPYILGISAGASTGAAAALLFGVGVFTGVIGLAASAFVGAALATFAVLALAHMGGRPTSARLLLAGVTIGYLLHALTSFLVFASDTPEGARSVMFWLLGSLALASPTVLPMLAVVVVGSIVILTFYARRMDALDLGDETAATIGIHPDRTRRGLLLLTAVLVGVTVSCVGSIGFVGLVVPHLARRAVGAAHRYLIPAAALMGGAFIVLADVLARIVFAPQELPIGIVTALVGTPLLVRHVVRLRDNAF